MFNQNTKHLTIFFMKKIIYSLVMLVAVGSLFTSCIAPDEPQGVYELRHAKAEYIQALKDLTAGQKALYEAQAAHENAKAEVEKANAALVNAKAALEALKADGVKYDNEAKKIANEALKIKCELENAQLANKNTAELEKLMKENELHASNVAAKIEENNAKIAKIKAQAEVDAVNAQRALNIANADLKNTIDSINAYAMLLSDDEGAVVTKATTEYITALDEYNTALNEYTKLVAQTYIDTYDSKHLSKEYLKEELNELKEKLAEAEKVKETLLANDGKPASWKAEIKNIEDQITAIEKNDKELAAEQAYAAAKYRQCYEAFRESLEDLMKEYMVKYMDMTIDLAVEVALPERAKNTYIFNQFEDYISPFVAGGLLEIKGSPDSLYLHAPFMDAEGVIYAEPDPKNIQPVGLKEIIETFRREQVIIDNVGHDKMLADAKQAKKTADSIYFAHKEILEAGVMAYQPVSDAVAKVKTASDELAAAQAAEKKVKDDAKKAKEAASKKCTEDSTAAVKAYNDAIAAADKAYDDAVAAAKQKQKDDSAAIVDAAKEFAYDINYFFGTIGGGDMDTAKVFAAIKKYAEFISKFNTPQDTIKYYNGLDADSNPIVGAKAIQDLTLEDMTATGLIGKYAYSGNLMPNEGTVGIPEAEIFAHVIRVLVYDNAFNKSTDVTSGNLKIYDGSSFTLLTDLANAEVDPTDPEYLADLAAAQAAKDKAYDDALKAKNTAITDAQKARDDVYAAEDKKIKDAEDVTAAKNTALATAKTNLEDAVNDFYAVYDSFWGYTGGTHTSTVAYNTNGTVKSIASPFTTFPNDSLTVVYTENTFVDPDDIVTPWVGDVMGTPYLMDENEELAIVLYNLGHSRDNSLTMTDYFNDPTLSYIFFNDKYNEFADRFFANSVVKMLEEYEHNLATLAALEKAVNELEDAYKAKVAEIAEYNMMMVADMAELTGVSVEEILEDPTLAEDMLAEMAKVLADTYNFDQFIKDFVNPLTGKYVYNNLPADLFGEAIPVEGKFLEMMNELLNAENIGDFGTTYANWKNTEKKNATALADLNILLNKLDKIYMEALALEAGENMPSSTAAKYNALYEDLETYLKKKVKDLEKEVYDLEKEIDTIEAGADLTTVNAAIAEQKLAQAKEKLDVAETKLDDAKATYEAVIAAYLNKN